mmetsp:Transcript_23021/g.40734  ORF Transcript_23021/g.40734 Transcript_23021/m.40734 type:complete len:521 (+) Transcript_23021:133-1695(+)
MLHRRNREPKPADASEVKSSEVSHTAGRRLQLYLTVLATSIILINVLWSMWNSDSCIKKPIGEFHIVNPQVVGKQVIYRDTNGKPAAIQPQVEIFSDCVRGIAKINNLKDYMAYIAGDNEEVVNHVVTELGVHGTWNKASNDKPNGDEDSFENTKMRNEALIDLLVVSRAKYVIGTRYSTFSALAAGMNQNDIHYMAYPGLYDQCVEATSPVNSLSDFDARFNSGISFSIHGKLSGLRCVNQELLNALQATCGAYDPFVRSNVTLLGPNGYVQNNNNNTTNRMLKKDYQPSETYVQNLISAYADLHKRIMDPTDTSIPKRFYLGTTHTGNIGNRAQSMAMHLLLAMQSKRALIFNPEVLKGLKFPVDIDSTHAPGKYKIHIPPQGTGWMELEAGFCHDYTANTPEPVYSPPKGAPNLIYTLVNPYFRDWFFDKVGVQGLRQVMRWMFMADDEILPLVQATEMASCNKSPCDIGVHIRRGRVGRHGDDFDFYFPAELAEKQLQQLQDSSIWGQMYATSTAF